MSGRKPLPLSTDHWRSRWLVLPKWDRLHRVSEITWEGEDAEDDPRQGTGTTLCGRKGYLQMPGMISRLALPRCAHCCRLAGIPRGDGAPFNDDIEEPS